MYRLVSIIIGTYNSSNFIEETLNSIKAQTWPELELIITDDCSQDNTIETIQSWFAKNRERFVRTQLITVPANTGVSANGNRGLQEAKGEWIKFLGADDTLLPGCITDNMQYLIENPSIRVLFSKVHLYRDNFDNKNILKSFPNGVIGKDSIIWPGRNALSQYKMLLVEDRINFTPSVFLHRETLLSVGGFDERFRMMEDYPLWLKLTKAGHRLYYMDKATVNYRQHSKAINNTIIDHLLKPSYFKTETFRKTCTYPNMPWDIRWSAKCDWYGSQIFRLDKLNRNKKLNRILLEILTSLINPFRYYIYLKKRLIKDLKNNEFYS